MNDEFRGHDPQPTERERAWMDFDPLGAIGRAAVMLVIAVALGGYVSFAIDVAKPSAVAHR
jgi:hypothetical protein